MKKLIKTNKKHTIARFKEASQSRLMLGEPRMVGFFMGSYVQLQYLFGEKAFYIWDFLIHIEAVGYFKKTSEGTELRYHIRRGYWNPIMILAWYMVPFIPFFFTIAANSLWDKFSPLLRFGLPAIPIGLRIIVTFICSHFTKKSKEAIKCLEEEINYEVERINKYPDFDVKEKVPDNV
ncbi:MAG: hypothetical protein GX225_01530 [Clostridiales bacterium]|nr:hypothetical protein [Clostridiales bacterium]